MKRLIALGFTLFAGSAPSMGSEVHGYEVPATYQLSICKSGCAPTDSRRAFSTVVVVLSMRPLSDGDPRPPGDGCFAVTNHAKSDSYVQREAIGQTHWTIENGKLKFALFRSPDAGYFVELEFKDNEVRGVGISRGAGSGERGRKPDQVVGYRSSAPDPENCKPWRPTPAAQQKFIPYSMLDDAQALALQQKLERAGVRNTKASDFQANRYDHHTFHDADVFEAYPQLRGEPKLSECSNRMMTNATQLVFVASKAKNEATLDTLNCNGDRDGIRCDQPAPRREHYYFLDGTEQYFTLDGLTFETAKAILETYAAGRISRLPEMLSTTRVNVTSIKALFDNRYRMIFGDYFCGGCSTVFDADFDTKDGERHLTVVGQPQGGCF